MRKVLLQVFICSFIYSCSTQKAAINKPITGLKFIGEYSLPYRTVFNGTTVGGLSSIDYAPAEDLYYLICDDRSDMIPARFYTARIYLTGKGIDSVGFINSVTLLQKNAAVYPNKKQDLYKVPDPEGLRLNRSNGTLVWTSEGERTVRQEGSVIVDPAINIAGTDGRLLDTFPLPPNMRIRKTESGPRQNGVFEGLAFADDYKTLYVSVEEPIYEDGPRAGLGDSTGWIRIIKYDVATKKQVAQYAYQIDPVVQEPISASAFKINGVPDILAINNHQLLVTERSFSTGRLGCNVRIYLADLEGAENIADITSLQKRPPLKPLQKKLLLNMDGLGRLIDNIEGATFGPTLSNGKRTLIFVADDNFSPGQKNQFLLFEIQN
ncbi:MAG: esterase-like of phytase family protein [Flavisolibacter sp.]|nr:esterase-like of phytase family protein [Flavisolibacter sp.]